MATGKIIYKDISELEQKQIIDGNEKLPISENEFITPEQITQGAQEQINGINEELARKYVKPAEGIPSEDMTPAVQQSLEKADSAYQRPGTGIPKTDLYTTVQRSLNLADSSYQKPASGIPKSDLNSSVQASLDKAGSAVQPNDIADFVTKSVDDLVNYYLKAETYTKAEVQTLIAAIKQFTYELVAVLPTASASTMNKIYLVPSPNSQTKNIKDEYITIESNGDYYWEQIGSTAIDLSGYVTTTALNTALANYTTTTDLATLLAAKQDTISDLETIRSGAALGAAAYQKPGTGIPSTDMASAVQTSLGKADTAYQKPSGGIPASDLASGVQTSLGKADTAVQPAAVADVVKYSAQSLTDTQKGQARTNIGALSSADVASLTSEEYVEVASLPTADATTLGKIYLVGPDGNGDYDRYITSYDGANYTWQPIGSTSIDLSDYATKEEVDQLDQKVDDLTKNTDADFAIADENGNNLIECRNGHIKTKKFNSEEDVIPIGSEEDADLTFADEDENVLCELSGGHIKTKYFDSSLLPIKAIKKAVFMGDSITQGVYSYWNDNIHTDANRYNGFDISDAASVSQSTAYHGIHYYFAKYAGCKIVNLGKRGTGWVADTRNLGNALVVANGYSFADVDFVALFFGVNDYIQGKTIGTIGTSGTVRGNMASVIQKIANDNPLCKIVVYSPYNTFGQVSKGGDYVASDTLYGDESTNYALGYDYKGTGTLADYISAIDDVCAYYGVQHIKLSASNVVNRLTIKNIMIDGLHPSKEAYPMLAAEIYGKGNFGA